MFLPRLPLSTWKYVLVQSYIVFYLFILLPNTSNDACRPCFSTAMSTIRPLPVKGFNLMCPDWCTKTDTFMYDFVRTRLISDFGILGFVERFTLKEISKSQNPKISNPFPYSVLKLFTG